jgi:hypothetical protein
MKIAKKNLPSRGASAAAACRIGSSSPRSRTSPARRTTPSSRTAPAYPSRRESELPPSPAPTNTLGRSALQRFFFLSRAWRRKSGDGTGNPLRSAPFSGFTPGSQKNSYGALMSLAKKKHLHFRIESAHPPAGALCETSIRGVHAVRTSWHTTSIACVVYLPMSTAGSARGSVEGSGLLLPAGNAHHLLYRLLPARAGGSRGHVNSLGTATRQLHP